MNPVCIYKHADNATAVQLRVPGRLIELASHVLPRAALDALALHGIDIRAIAQALRTEQPYQCMLEVYERGVRTMVAISIEK